MSQRMAMADGSVEESIEDRLAIARALNEKEEEVSDPPTPCLISTDAASDRVDSHSCKRPIVEGVVESLDSVSVPVKIAKIGRTSDSEATTKCLGERAVAATGDCAGVKIQVGPPSRLAKNDGKPKRVFRCATSCSSFSFARFGPGSKHGIWLRSQGYF